LLLLDEPLSALDRALREQLALDLAHVLRVSGTTALVVTHDHDEAFTLAGRVALMRAGRITQTGRPDEVWRSPADEETARFLGCTAFLPATVRTGVATCALGGVEVPWTADGPVRLGLRPAALRAVADAPLTGKVLVRVHRRDHVRLLVRLAELPDPVDAVAGISGAPSVGETVALRLDTDGIAVLSDAPPGTVTRPSPGMP
jgi:thiamine transport system ATP-binding protein